MCCMSLRPYFPSCFALTSNQSEFVLFFSVLNKEIVLCCGFTEKFSSLRNSKQCPNICDSLLLNFGHLNIWNICQLS